MLTAALVALVLPMTTYAQCPDGLVQRDNVFLNITVGQNRGSIYNPTTNEFMTDTTKHSAMVTVNPAAEQAIKLQYTRAQFLYAVQGEEGEGETLVHNGAYVSAGRLHNGQLSEIFIPISFHNLEPGKKYAAEIHAQNTNLSPERRLLFRRCFQTPTPAP